MGAIYNGGNYYSGSPTKTSQLVNDSDFLTSSDVPTFTIQTTEPSSVEENEIVFVVEE